jgi:hypothetical protein
MRSLIPCPSCQRHVESTDTACPFCETALVPSPDSSVCQGPCSGHASPRLGRVAMMAVGTTLLCAACTRSAVVEYGPAIILDAGGETADAGGQTDAAPDAVADAAK